MTSSFNKDYQALLEASQNAYNHIEEMRDFASFPDDIAAQDMTKRGHLASVLLQQEISLQSEQFAELANLIQKTAPDMCWRDIYTPPPHAKNKQAYEFSNRLGCYSLIGQDAPYSSDALRLFVIYMPANLHYPWHTHPAEEIYLVISGSAIFKRQHHPDEHLEEGQTMFHQSQLPHAIITKDEPMLSLVAWRNHLDTPPILIDGIS